MTRLFNKSSEKTKRQLLRNNMPLPEVLLWSKIRGKQIHDYRFRRQYSVGRYVLDFYCPRLKLAIEIDGNSHLNNDAKEYDNERQAYVEAAGIRFLRFSNDEVSKNIGHVLTVIAKAVKDGSRKPKREIS